MKLRKISAYPDVGGSKQSMKLATVKFSSRCSLDRVHANEPKNMRLGNPFKPQKGRLERNFNVDLIHACLRAAVVFGSVPVSILNRHVSQSCDGDASPIVR